MVSTGSTDKPARVLVVDDNAVVRHVLAGIVRSDDRLEWAGEATNGESALEMIRTISPDLICLDALLPDLDGLSVMERLREQSTAARVVMITGYATPKLIARAQDLGIAGIVVKPFSAAKVLECIHDALLADVLPGSGQNDDPEPSHT